MLLPDVLELFREQAQQRVAAGQIQEIIFSGPTYQIHVPDGDESIWVFLQLDQNDQVKDLFCSCARSVETGACVHMAMAAFAVFRGVTKPLHRRFEASPFSHIFTALCRACPEVVCRQQGNMLRWESGSHVVLLKGSRDWMSTVQALSRRCEEETEATSIKFSALSDEELAGWRQGLLSDRLRFELSRHSDLAKMLFLRSEREPYRFSFDDGGLPHRCRCDFEGMSCTFPILGTLPALLDSLPPALTTPRLELYGGRSIRELAFDEEEHTCTIVLEGREIDLADALPIPHSPWWCLPGMAFVRTVHPSQLSMHDPVEIAQFLDCHVRPSDAVPLLYDIRVDENEGLVITPYLREPGDVASASFLGHWIYHKARGFQRVLPPLFPTPCFRVALKDLTEFFAAHRHWLSSMRGFAVHEHPPRELLSYEVDSSQALIFHREHTAGRAAPSIELGDWVFIEGEGFFPRVQESRVPYERPIPPHRVAEFIRAESAWLHEVPGFFASSSSLITGVRLDIRCTKKRVDVVPMYQWTDPSYGATAVLYDEIGYVLGVGFFFLPALLAHHRFTRSYSMGDREQWDRFFLEQLPALQHAYPCFIDPRLERPKQLRLVCHGLEPHEVAEALRLPSAWDATLVWESEKGSISVQELYRAYCRGERFLPSAAGLLDLTDERFGWLASVSAPRPGKALHLTTTDFLKIRAHDDMAFSSRVVPTTAAIIQRLLNAVPPIPPDLSMVRAHLRPYQQHGVRWLWHLYLAGLSGLLCDDMGVGKTHQAMGLLNAVSAAFQQCGKRRPQFLIVCPTSLLWHWRDKLASFVPHLRVFTYVGSSRLLDEFSEDDLLLTTYGIWRNDVKALSRLPFEVAIFDELQIAKNHVSQIWGALSRVRASMRLGLTGTPVENQLRELKAVFDLVLPGYLPREELFRATFLHPSDDGEAGGQRELLSRYVRPFLLRRRKQDVLPDLPPKSEDLYLTELTGEQRDLYREVAARQAAPLIQQLHDAQSPVPYMHIFALISALKQICNHPASYLRDIENYARYDSGKWEAFLELLEEAQESNQKVVVFSQFLPMLDIMGAYLRSQNIGYAEIRGSTKERGREVARFQEDPACHVFLGSLQASGLGIDLTAGSVVIHYDRWWNAARENQATDRVHRIGQTRGVMVYKLMTARTIEERVDQIIARKARLFEDVISYDDHQVVKKLDRTELLELLEGLELV